MISPLLRIAAACLGALISLVIPAGSAGSSPNIVIVLTDDQGYADVGCYGAQAFTTPNLDRLAREGTCFTSFYVAQPVCSPSRAALLTGCYPNRLGITGVLSPTSEVGIHPEETTLAELCRTRGYAAAAFGKWHLGDHPSFLPIHHGFDEYLGIPYSNDMWKYGPVEFRADFPELPLIEGDRPVLFLKDQSWLTTWLTERAVRFIESHASQPFLLYLAHPQPHVPLYASPGYQGSCRAGLYGDVITEIDASLGQLLDVLDRLNLANNTFVLFLSDNGPWLKYGDHAGSAAPLREGKGTTFEGGVRVPCLMRWPGHVPAGRVCDDPLMTIDILPTIARLTGSPPPARRIDGKDVWPLLAGEPGAVNPHEAYFFYYNRNDLEAMRLSRWKLHFPHAYRTLRGSSSGSSGRHGTYREARTGLELYDLENDPGETTNLADRHPDIVARMQVLASAMREDLGDDLTQSPGSGRREPGLRP
jgi:arylsulfatase A-like enzyme